jgi:hypothetical protein
LPLLAVIPFLVLLKLPGSEICSDFRCRGVAAPRMPMPETAMNEHQGSVPGQDFTVNLAGPTGEA